ncbi:MAG: ABC transporter ATP-binding protein/permease [Ruminococcaceae bacterium]|nr:ABC transporter ATP-binding protein/permease [Oscillospiraceae bacterium]
MLQLKNIVKTYTVGDTVVHALNGISLNFRNSEFVSILGPSGCGKTTTLNIIGGLDRYTSGDLLINGKSTTMYKDRDWDTYRNHSIGFVFQSYNLIPHQSVLSNVELALTVSGVPKAERRRRAREALEKVGLGDQLSKRPSQMSGGQMQRVSIARALVNDPDILLADEPTGALDTVTSVQIMELLKEISKDKLVIMVTHNPELAETYSTRIVQLRDGNLIGDSDPYEPTEQEIHAARTAPPKVAKGKARMSTKTAFSLSLNNLMTKKARTFLTSFAGSIGIIGIALILSLSTGINNFIDHVQEDTLSTYPITIYKTEQDYSALIGAMQQTQENVENRIPDDQTVWIDDSLNHFVSASTSRIENNLTDFKAFLDDHEEELAQYVSDIRYTYNYTLKVYSADGKTQVNPTTIFENMGPAMGGISDMMGTLGSMSGGFTILEQMIDNEELIRSQYELVGQNSEWADDPTEIMLVLDKNNAISNMTLYMLGLQDQSEIADILINIFTDPDYEIPTIDPYSVDDFIGMTFLVVPDSAYYYESEETFTVDGKVHHIWKDIRNDADYDAEKFVKENGVEITISGLIRPSANAMAASIGSPIAYNTSLQTYMQEIIRESDVVRAQEKLPGYDITTGLEFDEGQYLGLSDKEKAELFDGFIKDNDQVIIQIMLDYIKAAEEDQDQNSEIAGMSRDEKINFVMEQFATLVETNPDIYKSIMLGMMKQNMGDAYNSYASYFESMTAEQLGALMAQSGGSATESEKALRGYLQSLSDEDLNAMVTKIKTGSQDSTDIRDRYTDEQLVQAFEETYAAYNDSQKAILYDEYMPNMLSPNSMDRIMSMFGWYLDEKPASISIYSKDFAAKDYITALIDQYNQDAEDEGMEENVIHYTDMIGLMMSSITIIIDVISYVLIAFVSISLVVSSIMIGIITYISVLERTKEIGILRSIGASKGDIAKVFNAETAIVGFTAGMIGIIVTILLNFPISWIVQELSGMSGINAVLPWWGAVGLVAISMILTLIAGLFPATLASKKDPVEALRTE